MEPGGWLAWKFHIVHNKSVAIFSGPINARRAVVPMDWCNVAFENLNIVDPASSSYRVVWLRKSASKVVQLADYGVFDGSRVRLVNLRMVDRVGGFEVSKSAG